ncbi:MAG: imidazole glycerol phosphate synthase subunit HisH [Candidatus Sumerlaeaceae bacterium]|nr:imidazole glycerol phosphate synthase subunit HisH [Candidatus Sumerlaeaceae bacterium]
MSVAIVDYGMGNLRSVSKACERLGAATNIVETPDAVEGAERLIVPGVGAFGDAMQELDRRGLVDAIRRYARSGRPVLGICLGLQIFFDTSEEAPGVAGLSLLPGTVRRFRSDSLKIPHMGWNRLDVRRSSRLLGSLDAEPFVYFVHSYYVIPQDDAVIAATAEYGIPFVAAVERDALFGVQFHPEKSQQTGLEILRRFLSI